MLAQDFSSGVLGGVQICLRWQFGWRRRSVAAPKCTDNHAAYTHQQTDRPPSHSVNHLLNSRSRCSVRHRMTDVGRHSGRCGLSVACPAKKAPRQAEGGMSTQPRRSTRPRAISESFLQLARFCLNGPASCQSQTRLMCGQSDFLYMLYAMNLQIDNARLDPDRRSPCFGKPPVGSYKAGSIIRTACQSAQQKTNHICCNGADSSIVSLRSCYRRFLD